MQTIQELGAAIAQRRRSLGLRQGHVAATAGLAQAALSRFERGKLPEFGSRKLLLVLAALGLELHFAEIVATGSLDELRKERGGGA